MTRSYPRLNTLGAILLVATAGPAVAQAQGRTAKAPPAGVAKLLECRSIAADSERLACFDRQSADFAGAVARRDVVMIDRDQARETRRSLFGFSLPDFGGLIGGGDEDEIREINAELASATYDQGGLRVTLKDGSSWAQTDDARLGRIPGPGAPVRIRRGSFGSYMMKVGNLPAVRARRVG